MRNFIFLVLMTSALGCVSDEAARYYADRTYPPRPAEEVDVLRSAPTRGYVVIADFQARGASINQMREKAAKIGADAVIVTLLGGYRSRGDEWASIDTYKDSYTRITGTAILYK